MTTLDARIADTWVDIKTSLTLTEGTRYMVQVTGNEPVLLSDSTLAPVDTAIPFKVYPRCPWWFEVGADGIWVKSMNGRPTVITLDEAPA